MSGHAGSLWSQSWEDDLIMTGVRSFDIKAYDNSLGGLRRPGLGRRPAADRSAHAAVPGRALDLDDAPVSIPYLAGNYDPVNGYVAPASAYINGKQVRPAEPDLRPRGADAAPGQRQSPRRPVWPASYLPSNSPYLPAIRGNYSGNIGDDQVGIVRLRRVWDSWSTDYSRAPGTGVYLNKTNPTDPLNGFPWGPPYTPPIYPSYPPPYPAPLRGIQIQIRVDRPDESAYQDIDDPSGFHGQVVAVG